MHLGRLAVNLRMLGFPADYSNSRSDEELARLADSAVNGLKAIVLSCDRGLMMRRCIKYGMVVRVITSYSIHYTKLYDLEGP